MFGEGEREIKAEDIDGRTDKETTAKRTIKIRSTEERKRER